MRHRKIPSWAFAVLAALLLFAIGSAVHNAAWSQGYTMGLLAGGGDTNNLTPYLISRTGPTGFAGGFFGALFRIGFVVFLFALFAKFVGFWHWRMHGKGWQGGSGGHHGPWRHHSPFQPDDAAQAQEKASGGTSEGGGGAEPAQPTRAYV